MPRPIQHKPNKDHWGFYQVGPYKTYSKLDAIEISGRTKHDIVWNFNNEVFSHYDWTTEPPGDLEFWYKQRAEQLRNHYDYIILFLSGGFDSMNILQTFVKNNIFVDEIVHLAVIDGYHGDKTVNANREGFEIAIPFVEKLKETNPTYKHTKLSLVDISDYEQDCLIDNKWDYFYNSSIIFCPASHAFAEIREKNNDMLETHSKYSKVCMLYGIDKPKVWVDENGNGSVTFTEVAPLMFVKPSKQQQNHNWAHDEMFYWTPDMPEIVCKQAHELLRFLKQTSEQTLITLNLKKESLAKTQGNWNQMHTQRQFGDSLYIINDEMLANVLYKKNLPNLQIKPASLFFGSKDQWLWDQQAPDIGQRRFLKGLVWLKQTVLKSRPDLWWDRPGDPSKSILPTGGFVPIKNTYRLTKGKI